MTACSINPEEFGRMFKNEDFKQIYHCTSKDFQQLIPFEQFIELSQSFNKDVESYQLEFKTSLQDVTHYIWLNEQKEKAISVYFDKNNEIQRIYLKPFITYPESDHSFSQNTYIMPVKGEWFVFWGGTNEFINYHYPFESQRYAYDLVKVQDGSTYQNTQIQNENFFAFNEDIVAPADGKVIEIVDGFKDNIPGEMDAEHPTGNHVLIEHPPKEYSLLAHLKMNSIQVKKGELVKCGQLVGKCGNSGNSSEPHLHFQIMDSPDFSDGKSLRIKFKNGIEPIQGDMISNVQKDKEDATDGKIDFMENAMTIGEVLAFIPRAIAQFFK